MRTLAHRRSLLAPLALAVALAPAAPALAAAPRPRPPKAAPAAPPADAPPADTPPAAPAAPATPSPSPADARITALAERARQQRRAGDFDGAIASLKEAVGIRPEPFLLYNIARLYEDSARYDLARSHYDLCLGPNVDPETQTRAKDGLARLDKFGEHGRLELVLAPQDATVKLDGVVWDLDAHSGTSLTSGPHQLAVSAPGFVTFERRVEIVGGQKLNLVVNLAQEPTTVTQVVTKTEVVTHTVARTDLGAWPWLALGTGAVVAGVGAYFALEGRADQDEANSNTDLALGPASALYDQGSSKLAGGLAAVGIGGALIVTSVVLFLIDGSEEPAVAAADGDRWGHLYFLLAVSPSGGGVTGHVTF